ncbi:Checkpoint protein hus1 [Massospora cicadina]|nr:Checkpoint protein hus1 [Massospora cicadina]
MRLRGSIINVPLIYSSSNFTPHLTFEKMVLVKFLPDKLELILQSSLDEGMQIYSYFNTVLTSQHGLMAIKRKVFGDYVLETGGAPGFYIEVGATLLARALRSSNDSVTTFKVAKRNGRAFLKISTTHRSRTKAAVALSQDIPIRILTPDQVELVNEFRIPAPHVQFRLPRAEQLRHEVNRIKNFSDRVTVSANRNGEITLLALTELTSVKIGFKDIAPLNFEVGFIVTSKLPMVASRHLCRSVASVGWAKRNTRLWA